VSAAILLDAGPLGLLAHPRNPPPAAACRQWLTDLLSASRRVIVPEITDYEVRRELLRIGSKNGLINLDQLAAQLEYLPLTTTAMRKAAELWAQARTTGQPTAPDPALDCDVVLAAQALTLDPTAIVATGNPAHLSRFVTAELWQNIAP
jgi:predicted nucleic acid-binding protein